MARRALAFCLLGGLMALVIQDAIAQTSTTTATSTPGALVGVWQLTLTPSTSSVAGDTVIANFTPGGGVLVGPAPSGSSASNPALGNWSTSSSTGAAASAASALNQVTMSFTSDITNSDGSVAGTNSFKLTVKVSSSGTLTGSYQLVVTDGTDSTTTQGTITGTLISHVTPTT